MFDSINAYIMHDPSLLAQMKFLFMLRHWVLLGIIGIFVFLVYSEDFKKKRAQKKVPVPVDSKYVPSEKHDSHFLA